MAEPGPEMGAQRPLPGMQRVARIVAVYAIIGPVAGVVTFALVFATLVIVGPVPPGASRAEGAMEALRWALVIIVMGMPAGFWIGLPVAAGVGLVVALGDRLFGVISWRIALGATAIFWLIPYLHAGDLHVSGDVRLSRTNGLLPAYLVAAPLCTWIARRLLPNTSGASWA